MTRFFEEIMGRLQAAFSPDVIGNSVAELFANIIVALITFAVFYGLWLLLDRSLRAAMARANSDATTVQFSQTLLKYAVLTIGLIQALAAVGIDTGAVVASLGIAGLTIGFAARDALSNLISGLLIFWDRPFVIGDLVEVEDSYGRVENITLRSTRIVTVDGRMLAVPNSAIINNTVASYTNFPHLRLDIGVTIAVTEIIDRARALMLGLVENDSSFMEEPKPRVVVTALNDYNVALQLQVWLADERLHIPKRFELREKVFDKLTEAGVQMPYETFQLAPLSVKLATAD